MTHPYWPLFDLEVRTPRLTMRYVDDELAIALASLAAEGIHDPGFMPFAMPWTRAESPQLERDSLKFFWRSRAETSPTKWMVNFAVIVDGTVVGTSGLMADDFSKARQFETGSWLGRRFQGRGIGKEMRLATLTVGFSAFDAEWATTSAWHDNGPSLGVTRGLGYTELGWQRRLRDDRVGDRLLTFEMGRAHFDEHLRRGDIEVSGTAGARDLLGIS
jgi:RimJ/RimL family protein N-acetyltransferase